MATTMRTNYLGATLVLLMILSALTPIFANLTESEQQSESESNFEKLIPDVVKPHHTGARAQCSVVQNDGGTTGDAGNTTATAKMMGTDPTISNSPGCLDASDADDWYNITLSNNQRLDVDMSGPTNADFDLMLHDGVYYYALSTNLDSNESISYSTNSTNGGVYYVRAYVYSGDGNYNLDYQTTDLSSAPDLTISDVSGPANATAGDTVTLDYNLSNVGAGDYIAGNDPIYLTGWLSTNDVITNFDFEMEGNSTIPSVSSGQSVIGTLSVTIPEDQGSGTFYWGVIVDAEDDLVELADDNNSGASSTTANITALACAVIDDAGTGGDVGDDKSTAYVLGDQYSGTVSGCLSGDDTSDFYEIHVHRNQNISAVLTMDPDVDFDLILSNQSNAAVIDFSYNVTEGHHENVTNAGTSSDLTEGDYVLEVNRWSGIGNYSLEIWVNGTPWEAPYDCGPENDWGISDDAGDSRMTAITIGENPGDPSDTVDDDGIGCLDPEDTKDAYGFTLTGMHGISITMDSLDGHQMSLELYDGSDDSLIVSNTAPENGSATVDTTGLMPTELEGGYYVVVNANGVGEGWYNLSFTQILPPLPNLVANDMNCPTANLMTDQGSERFGASVSSTDGPTEAHFDWNMWLVNENGEEILLLLNGNYTNSLDGYDGEIFSTSEWRALESGTIATGNYTCVLTVDVSQGVSESNETDNVLISAPFYIENYAEKWAGDSDYDGILDEIDDCANQYGNSSIDQIGCRDSDGDGWSNQGDAFPGDPNGIENEHCLTIPGACATQWNDTDMDGFGDNNGAGDYNGDACPTESGVMGGTNGQGCPIVLPDDDDDGVPNQNDLCLNEAGPESNNGCPVDDGTDVNDGTDGTDVTNSTDDGTDGDDDNQGSSETSEKSDSDDGVLMMVGIAAAVVGLLVLVLATTLFMRSRRGGADPTEQAWAAAISPEQQQYESQLIAMGYTAEQARAYASQYFQ